MAATRGVLRRYPSLSYILSNDVTRTMPLPSPTRRLTPLDDSLNVLSPVGANGSLIESRAYHPSVEITVVSENEDAALPVNDAVEAIIHPDITPSVIVVSQRSMKDVVKALRDFLRGRLRSVRVARLVGGGTLKHLETDGRRLTRSVSLP